MSPRDRLITMIKRLNPRFAGIASGRLNDEISLATRDQLPIALKSMCDELDRYNIPISSQEWKDIQSLEQALNTHVRDLRYLVQ